MNYQEYLNTVSSQRFPQILKYAYERSYFKYVGQSKQANPETNNIVNYQKKLNGLFIHVFNYIDKFSTKPEDFLPYIRDSIYLNLGKEKYFEQYKVETNALNLSPEILEALFNGDEHTYVKSISDSPSTLESLIPNFIADKQMLSDEVFQTEINNICEKFNLHSILVPKVFAQETNVEIINTNIEHLLAKLNLSSPKFFNYRFSIILDDKDYILGEKDTIYDRISVWKEDGIIYLRSNSECFFGGYWKNLPEEIITHLNDNLK